MAKFPSHLYRRGNGNPHRRPHRERLQSAPFVAWDGEGYSTDDGDHHYMLFGSSDGAMVRAENLDYRDCFPLLLDSKAGINIIFGGDYDIIMMTKHMPFPVRKRLFASLPVKYGGYRLVWLRRKYLLIKEYATGRSTVLYDVQSFFQCSFVKACREYLGDRPEFDEIHAMKVQRDGFTYDNPEVLEYWRSELRYLVELMDELRRLLAAVDIKPTGWYGPGAVASALLSAHKQSQHYSELPQPVVDIGERCYYGGRFEQFKVGKVDNVVEYDIRSAYPKAISLLPSFRDAAWRHEIMYDEPTKHIPMLNPYAMYCVSWDIPFTPHQPGPLPWRDSMGRIFYPLSGRRSWYWGCEIDQTLIGNFPPDMFTIHEAWIPIWSAPPEHAFPWVEAMYNDRARMKAEGNPAQRALKLGLNSLYGKLAQSTGAFRDHHGAWRKPRWHHILWAGWITAYTRGRIYSAIKHCKAHLVAIETDAVFVMRPLDDITVGEKLGEWERTDIEQILYVSSGVYYALNGGVWKLKSRGVEADRSKSADHWLDIFSRLPQTSVEITLKLRRFGTDLRQPKRFGRWFDYETHTRMPHAFSKRVHQPGACLTCQVSDLSYADHHHYLIVPEPMLSNDFPSTPYKFPWRNDVRYDWPEVIKSEAIELPEDIGWNYA